MTPDIITLLLNLLSSHYQALEKLYNIFKKKKFLGKLKNDIKELYGDFFKFIEKVKNQGHCIKKETIFNEILGLLKRWRLIKVEVVNYMRAYSSPEEKAEIEEILRSIDHILKLIIDAGDPKKLAKVFDDPEMIDKIKYVYGEEKAKKILEITKKGDWHKYPKDYLEKLRRIAQDIYDVGRSYTS